MGSIWRPPEEMLKKAFNALKELSNTTHSRSLHVSCKAFLEPFGYILEPWIANDALMVLKDILR